MKGKISFIVLLLLGMLIVSFVPSVMAYGVTVDGDPSDWKADTSAQADNTGQYYNPPLIFGGEYVWKDAVDDDVGDGDYTYPTDAFFAGSDIADLTEFRVTCDTKRIYFLVRLARVTDDWSPPEGFCGILVTIHIDQDKVPGSGQEYTAQFMDAKKDPACWWEYVVILHGWGSWAMDKNWATVAWTGNGMAVAGSEVNSVIEASIDYAKIGHPVSGETWKFEVVVGLEESAGFREVTDTQGAWTPGGGVPAGTNDWVECDGFDGAFYASTADQITDWSDYDQGAGNPTILCNTGQGCGEIQFAPPVVGGFVMLIDKLALIAPWIILAALVATVAVSATLYWRKRAPKTL